MDNPSTPPDVYCLVGIGENEQETPALIFKAVEDAKTFLAGLTPALKLSQPDGKKGKYVVFLPDGLDGGDGEDDDGEDTSTSLADSFFTSYYGECGAIHMFELRPVWFGKPFACHNLD